MLKKLPHRGTPVETPDGRGIVADVATLKGEVRVKFEDGDSVRFGNYKLGDFKTVERKDKGNAENKPQSKETPVEGEAEPKKNKRGRRDKKKPRSKNGGDSANTPKPAKSAEKPIISPSDDDAE